MLAEILGNNNHLREFVALHYERHPESMRTVPRVCPAGRDSAPVHPLHPLHPVRVPIMRVLDRGNGVSTYPNIAKVL